MLEQHDTQSLTGFPGLSQIPILKYLFSQKNTEVSNNEIVFAVIPHIIRRTNFDEFNRRMIDVGTGNSVHLRHAPKSIVETDSDKTSATAPSATAPGEADVALELDPTAISVSKGSTFMLNVDVSGAQDVQAVPLQVTFDMQGLELLNVSNGGFLSQGDQIVALVHREDGLHGAVDITASRPSNSGGVSGHGVVTTLTFQAKAAGRFPVKIAKGSVVQPGQRIKAASGSQILVSVQ
jgi:general secretion pathway protein D